MAFFLRSFCLLSLPSLTLGVRSAVEDSQDIDWKKLGAIGAVGAHGLASYGAMAAEDGRIRKPQQEQEKFEAMLMDHLRDADESVVKKLFKSAAGRDRGSIEGLEAPYLQDHLKSEPGVEHYSLFHQDGSRGAVLKRYLSKGHRSPEEVAALQNELRSLRQGGTHFLHVFAKSHSPNGVSKDQDTEVMVMLEPFSGTLREYLYKHKLSLPQRLTMFHSIMTSVNVMHMKSIPHNSVITPDNVLVAAGDDANMKDPTAVLCPSVLSTDLQVCSIQRSFWSWLTGGDLPEGVVGSKDLAAQDARHLGELLEWIIKSDRYRNHQETEPLLGFAEEMKSGAFDETGFDKVTGVFTSVLLHEIARQYEDKAVAEHFGEPAGAGSLADYDGWVDVAMTARHEYPELVSIAHVARDRGTYHASKVIKSMENKMKAAKED